MPQTQTVTPEATPDPVLAATGGPGKEQESRATVEVEGTRSKAEKNGDSDQAAPVKKPEFTVDQKKLLQELAGLQRVVDRRSTIPILNNILIEAKGGTLTLTATDLDLSLRTTCPASIRKPGSCTVPARKLYDYLRLLPPGDIHITVLDNSWVKIKADRSHTKMVGLERANFPRLPVYPRADAVKLSTQMLREMIAKSNFAVSTEESRYTLNGALLQLAPERATMVATDGHRLAYVESAKPVPVKEPVRVLIPKKALNELVSLLATEAEHLEFARDQNHLFFLIDGRLLTCRELVGAFPDYERIMPNHSKAIVLPAMDTLLSLQRVSQFADQRSLAVRLHIQPGKLRLASSNPENGESEETVDITYDGKPLVMAFNSDYLEQFLRAAKTERVQFQFEHAEAAAEMRPDSAVTAEYVYRYVVMPMRA